MNGSCTRGPDVFLQMLVPGAPQRYVPFPQPKPCRSHRFHAWPGASSRAHHLDVVPRFQCAPDELVCSSTIDVSWFRLPPNLLSVLASVGVDSLEALRAYPESQLLAAFTWEDYSKYQELLLELRRSDGPSTFHVFRLLAKYPAAAGAFQISDFRPIARQASATLRRATPSSNVGALQALKRSGWDPRVVCDAVADARASSSVRDSSAKSYDYHLRGIEFVCGVLGEAPLPASLATIRRVSSHRCFNRFMH